MNEAGLADELLSSARTVAVVGYSADAARPSNSVSRYLRRQGYRVVPVNPRLQGEVVDGERAYDRIGDIPERVDLVDVFRRGDFLDDVVDDAIAAKVPAIWFQLGLGNEAAALRAEAAGLRVVWDRCTAIEHRRMRAARGAD
ncbi:MAG: CoA-binding protein [Candidatus Limnocylindria bacterium]